VDNFLLQRLRQVVVIVNVHLMADRVRRGDSPRKRRAALRPTYHGLSCEGERSEVFVCCRPKLASLVSTAAGGKTARAARQSGKVLE